MSALHNPEYKSIINRVYAPYRNSKDFAVVECEGGLFYLGCRVENQVYPLTIEAAQAAIGVAFSELQKPVRLHLWKNDFDLQNSPAEIFAKSFDIELILHSINDPIPSIEHPKIAVNKPKISQINWPKQEKTVPESSFQVGCLLKCEEGWIQAFNFENSFHALGLCAERVAIAKAIAYDLKILNEIHIFTLNCSLATPCGACRQVGFEHFNEEMKSFLHSKAQVTKEIKWTEFLPYPFDLSR